MVEDIATRIRVLTDTSELDKIPNNGAFASISDVVKDLKDKIESGADELAGEATKALKQYEEEYFNYHTHPFETGTAKKLFEAEPEGTKVWFVDNKAENRGFPYMITEEYGTNPGRKLPFHPFAAPAREKLESEIEKIGEEIIIRKL